MKRVFLFLLVATVVLASGTVYAADSGKRGRIGVKVSSLNFTDDFLSDIDSDNGTFLALEARSRLTDHLDVGFEFGYSRNTGKITGPKNIKGTTVPFSGTLENKFTYLPMEANVSYTAHAGPLALNFGTGISINFVRFIMKADTLDTLGNPVKLDKSSEKWVKGAQVFADISYDINNFYVGIDGKFQFVENQSFFNNWWETSFNNWRLGAHAGFFF